MYDIVSKLIIQEGRVYSVFAPSDRHPRRYTRRDEPALTQAFQREGLHGLLAAVAREMHRGHLRTRADSRLTRALRKALHTLGVPAFLAMDEEEAVRRLTELAEEILSGETKTP